MSSYSIIADVSYSILGLLKKNLVPGIIPNADEIVLSYPGERGDASLCLGLYDIQEIRENELSGRGGMINDGIEKQVFPPMYLNLFYVIMAFSSGDIKYRAVNEQKVLGKVLQTMKDYPALDRQSLEAAGGRERTDIHMELLQLSIEEKNKILSTQGLSQKASLFYRVYPVDLESLKSRRIKRVKEIDMVIGRY